MNKLFKGTICRVAFQCISLESGQTGTFLYTGESCRLAGSQCSPVFESCYYLFQWASQNGFHGIGQDYVFEGQTVDRSKLVQNELLPVS